MRVKYINTIAVAAAFSAASFTAQANDMNDNNRNHNWMPQQPSNNYWQAPNWSGFSTPPSNNNAAPPAYAPPPPNANYRPPAPPRYNQPYPQANNQGSNFQRQNNQAPNRNQQNMNRGMPPQNAYRGNPYPQQRGQHPGPNMNMNRYGPDNGASAYNIPRYNRNNNGWNNNKFWGNSGPNRWMNPNKGNMEQGWDDMINSPSRMGEMPGGWTAPEVTMPNPVDMGDQVQDNVKDLPEQIRNMDVGN